MMAVRLQFNARFLSMEVNGRSDPVTGICRNVYLIRHGNYLDLPSL